MAKNPDTLVLVIWLMAFFVGPCLYISLYTITCIIDHIIQYLSPNHQPPFKLGPETLVSCPDGLCYLAMFRKDCYDKVIQNIGYFPSIFALSTVPHYYRRQSAKGIFKLIGDNLAHYKSKIDGDPAWEIVDKLTLPLHLVGSKELVRVSTSRPQLYQNLPTTTTHPRHDHAWLLPTPSRSHAHQSWVSPSYQRNSLGYRRKHLQGSSLLGRKYLTNTGRNWKMAEHHPNDKITC